MDSQERTRLLSWDEIAEHFESLAICSVYKNRYWAAEGRNLDGTAYRKYAFSLDTLHEAVSEHVQLQSRAEVIHA